MGEFFDWVDAEPGVRRKIVSVGDSMMQMVVELQAGAVTASHKHPHEQIACVTIGEIEFTVDGQPILVRAGETLVLKSNCFHGARAIVDSKILDTFHPLREDLLTADRKRFAGR